MTVEKKKRGGVRKKATNQKRSKRSDFEFPYLEPSVSLGKRKEETEDVASYIKNCSKEVQAWMNQFMKEEVNADLTNSKFNIGEIIKDNNGETVMTTNIYGMVDKKSVPLTDRKRVFDKNNARNRCWYTEEAAANRLNLVETEHQMEQIIYNNDVEDQDKES